MKAATKKRTAPKAERQQQLIQATIRSVARNGLSDTTMATVSREAGLSQGIINLHFQSKDRLLVETLRWLSEHYRAAWEKAIEKAGDAPADKLRAMVEIDFRQPVCDRNKLAVWFAFWGESKSRPTYRKICALRDLAYRNEMVQVCEELIEEGGYEDDLRLLARPADQSALDEPRPRARHLHVVPGSHFSPAFRLKHPPD